MQHPVVGFDLAGDPLLNGDRLPFQDGLTVIYGLNGAGKTRLLEGIRGALTGVATEAEVHFVAKLHPPSAEDLTTDSSWGQRAPGVGLLLAIAEQLAAPTDFRMGPQPGERVLDLQRADELIDEHIRKQFADSDSSQELLEEVLADRLVLLVPAGTPKTPRWDAWMVADPAGRHLAAELERLESGITAYESDDDASSETLVDLLNGSPVRSTESAPLRTSTTRTLYPRSVIPYTSEVSPYEEVPGIVLNGPIDFGFDVLENREDVAKATLDLVADVVTNSVVEFFLRDNGDQSDEADAVDLNVGFQPQLGSRSSAVGFIKDRLRPPTTHHMEIDAAQISRAGEHATQVAARLASELERRAADVLNRLLFDAPLPVLEVADPLLRFSSPVAEWTFKRVGVGQRIAMTGLSRAERQWAEFAIREALYWTQREHMPAPDQLRHVVRLMDEPEAALHRSAESHMSRGLVDLTRDPRNIVIAATHSPELLDANEARLVEVKRGAGIGGTSLVRTLDLSDREALTDLGLQPSDLLRWPRVFLLVEGAHDEALLDELVGDRLRAARVQILPLRGATKLPATIDSRVLFDFTDAHVVALVDNQDREQLTAGWEAAIAARRTTTLEAATSALADSLSGDTEEIRFLREWLTAALRQGYENRVTPQSLSAGDIIEYVPVGYLVPGAINWATLRQEHATAVAKKNGAPKDFKKWIGQAHKVSITPDRLRDAARAEAKVPTEIDELMNMLEAIAGELRSSVA